jgi:hypothetical protein
MSRGVKMFRGVAIRRRVAATDMSTRQAKAEVDPGRTYLQTILTPLRARNDVGIDLIEVQASFVHDSTFVDFSLISTFVPASPREGLDASRRAHGVGLLPPGLAWERLPLTCFSVGRRDFFSTIQNEAGGRDRSATRSASFFAH